MRRTAPCARVLRTVVPAAVIAFTAAAGHAQQTLGNLEGAVTDATGAAVAGTEVQLTGAVNGIKRTTTAKGNGVYQFLNLPVGVYSLSFSQQGFETSRVADVPVQESRTGTINVQLKAGSVATTVEVNEQPILNQTDAVNGYVLDRNQIQTAPLATGSFTHLATLTPGVSGELQGGIGTNAGLGNQPIWANGQRDTSNGFRSTGSMSQPVQRQVLLARSIAALLLQHRPGEYGSNCRTEYDRHLGLWVKWAGFGYAAARGHSGSQRQCVAV